MKCVWKPCPTVRRSSSQPHAAQGPLRCGRQPRELALVVPTGYVPCIVLHFLESILLRVQAMGEQRATNPHRSAQLNCNTPSHGMEPALWAGKGSGVNAGDGNGRDAGCTPYSQRGGEAFASSTCRRGSDMHALPPARGGIRRTPRPPSGARTAAGSPPVPPPPASPCASPSPPRKMARTRAVER